MELKGSIMLLMGAVWEILDHSYYLGDGLFINFWEIALCLETFHLVFDFIGSVFGKQKVQTEDY